MAVLLLPSEKIERKASMGKNDKMKETEYEEEDKSRSRF